MTELRGDLNQPFEGGVGEHVQVVSRKSKTRYGQFGQVVSVTCFDAEVAFDDANEILPAGWLKAVPR